MIRLAFRPLPFLGRLGWLRPAIGAVLGILLTGITTRLVMGPDSLLPFLIAPMGASSVLLFAIPASPLARPWPVLGGNTISALVGIACLPLSDDPAIVAAVAIALAIAVMSLARCLHPPGGAVAATVALGGPAVAAAGLSFALVPVFLNSILLLFAAWAYNNLTGHKYPHTAQPAPAPKAAPVAEFSDADIEAIIQSYDEVLDIDRDDLIRLIRTVESHGRKTERHKDGSGI